MVKLPVLLNSDIKWKRCKPVIDFISTFVQVQLDYSLDNFLPYPFYLVFIIKTLRVRAIWRRYIQTVKYKYTRVSLSGRTRYRAVPVIGPSSDHY